jgi:hypothetical protein
LSVLEWMAKRFGEASHDTGPGVEPLEEFLAAAFPPPLQLPSEQLCKTHRHWIAREARGLPGDRVNPGLFPSARIKNARLLLSIAGDVWPSRALDRARGAYQPVEEP